MTPKPKNPRKRTREEFIYPKAREPGNTDPNFPVMAETASFKRQVRDEIKAELKRMAVNEFLFGSK